MIAKATCLTMVKYPKVDIHLHYIIVIKRFIEYIALEKEKKNAFT